jgi:uncharacterized protein (DUF927 family)
MRWFNLPFIVLLAACAVLALLLVFSGMNPEMVSPRKRLDNHPR